MNAHLQEVLEILDQKGELSSEEKEIIIKLLKKADRELEISNFKLDRTEKVKRTTAILLEETITELEQKRKLVEESNEALEKSLQELKATQAQLIHSEKMASLGELTAGIAHEIQNPLNFVNNFSEVSSEMIEEVNEEIEAGALQEAKEILDDLKSNLEKITHHGKRASGIVKSMLDHSRANADEKVETDINELCDEYLRLAYHGMRAKERSFNATLDIQLAVDIPMIKVIPQDIGRVLLNLFNNGFQALSSFSTEEEGAIMKEDHEPTIGLSTKYLNGNIEISVSDNGPGIPENIKDKIFQPFFTTKPTGQGTGLGLSLSYDIIRSHGGTIQLESKEGEGSTFTIILSV